MPRPTPRRQPLSNSSVWWERRARLYFLSLAFIIPLLAVSCDSEDLQQTPVPRVPSTDVSEGTVTVTTLALSSLLEERARVLGEKGMVYLRQLAVDLGPRDLGSGGERRAAEHLATRFQELGYETRLKEFRITQLSDQATVTVSIPQQQTIAARPLQGSIAGQASGALVDVQLGDARDLEGKNLQGRIALIERGRIRFQEKVETAASAGAVAVVIYNNDPGLFRGTLTGTSDIPAVSMTQKEGVALRQLLGQGEVRVEVSVVEERLTSQNIIAERPGDPNRVVLLGAHYDTVPGTSGAMDNASGTAAILALAQEVAESSLPFTVRFLAFGGEELGLLGSRHYVRSLSPEERGSIVAALNFDVVAGASPLAVMGYRGLVTQLQSVAPFLANGSLPPGAAGDHVSFQEAGIPAVLLTTLDFEFIHTPQDTIQRVDPIPLGQAVAVALAYLEELKEEG